MGYVAPSAEFDEAVAELRATLMAQTRARHDLRLRPALPALDRPAPQGRAAGRALPLADRRRGPRRRDPRCRVHVPHAEDRAGARRPGDAALARPAGGDRPPRGRPGRGAARAPQPGSRRCSDADRLRRARQDGRQHGRADPPRLRPRGRRVRLRRQGSRARARRPARRGAANARARWSRRSSRRARSGSWSRPATRRRRPSTRWRSCSTPTTRSSTAATRKWTDDKARAEALREAEDPLRRRRHERRRVGPRGRLLHDGRRTAARPSSRLAPILDVLAPPTAPDAVAAIGPRGWEHFGPSGAGPLREDGPQRDRVRPDAGLRRGLRAVPRSPSSSSTTRRSPTCGTRARWSARGCASSPRARSRPTATTSPGSRAGSRTPARAAGRSQDAIDHGVPDAGAERRAQQPLLLARAGRLQRPRAGRAAQPVRRPRGEDERLAVTDTGDAPNPLAQGLERLPVPPTNLVIFGATGDLARRKLLPAIYNLAHEGALPERFNLIGVSRGELTNDEYRETAAESIRAFSRTPPDENVLGGPARRAALRRRRLRRPGRPTRQLAAALDELDEAAGEPMSRAFYLSTAPEFFPVIVEALGAAGLAQSEQADGASRSSRSRSAPRSPRRASSTRKVLVGLRRAARSSASTTTSARRPCRTCWRSASPTACSSRSGTATTSTNVQITAAEDIGIGSRAGYYDHAGRAARPRPEPHAAAAHAAVHGAAGDLRRRRRARREGQGAARDPRADAGRGRRR